jgi:Holliday junction resolvasome RuvABC DNA-binding subunit
MCQIIKSINKYPIKQINKLTTFAVMEFSKLIERQLTKCQLPGIGKRTTFAMVLHLLKQPKNKQVFYRKP